MIQLSHPEMRKRRLNAELGKLHADQRHAQHSQSHSVGRCDVVCGHVVRRVDEQIDSFTD